MNNVQRGWGVLTSPHFNLFLRNHGRCVLWARKGKGKSRLSQRNVQKSTPVMRLRAHGMDHWYTLLIKTDFIWTCAGIKFRISEYLQKKTTIKFQFKNETSCICAGSNWIKVEKDFQNCCILFLLTFYPKVPTSIESGSCRMTREERKKERIWKQKS